MKQSIIMVVAALLGWAGLAQADAMEQARARRRARKEQVEQLVAAGDAQEGLDGYLAPKAGLEAAQAAVVQAENADRRVGYEAIAKANNKTVEEVGRQAAAINRSRATKK